MRHQHGERACYSSGGCRKPECRAAHRAYENRRARLIAYGRWAPMVDAEPVRSHVRSLMEADISLRRTAELAGIPFATVKRLIYTAAGERPRASVRRETAEAILAVTADARHLRPNTLVDATGTRRRLQALVAVGWSMTRLAEQLGTSTSSIGQMMRTRPRVYVSTVARVRDLYDRLWDVAPPGTEWWDRRSAEQARRYAAERGWVPPLAWDDDAIDDPEAVPVGAGPVGGQGRLPEASELLWLADECRETNEAIADRFGVKPSAVRQALDRYRRATA